MHIVAQTWLRVYENDGHGLIVGLPGHFGPYGAVIG
jgi:hypothetical protein